MPLSGGGIPLTSFEADCRRVAHTVRQSLAEMLETMPGRPESASGIGQALGLDRAFAWHVSKILDEPNPFAALQHIPGRERVDAMLKAAERAGGSPDRVEALRRAIAEVERLAESHAGDRPSLDMMLASLAGADAEASELTHRRSAYRANSFLWGVQARVSWSGVIVRPNAEEPEKADIARLWGMSGLRRVAPISRCRLTRGSWLNHQGKPAAFTMGQPLDPRIAGPTEVAPNVGGSEAASSPPPLPLLIDFCSPSPPQIERRLDPAGWIEDTLGPGPIGETGAMTFFSGEWYPAMTPRHAKPASPFVTQSLQVRVPVELAVIDHWIRRGTRQIVAPRSLVHSQLWSGPGGGVSVADDDRLRVTAAVDRLGPGLEAGRLREIRELVEVMRYGFGRLGEDPEQYELLRLAVRFPPMPSLVSLFYDVLIPPTPAGAGATEPG